MEVNNINNNYYIDLGCRYYEIQEECCQSANNAFAQADVGFVKKDSILRSFKSHLLQEKT